MNPTQADEAKAQEVARKTAINKKASERYDALREFGRHGHYESMYQVIHMAIADELNNQYEGKISIGEDLTAMKLLRGKLSQVATSAEFNEWAARDICQYIDSLHTQLANAQAQLEAEQAMAYDLASLLVFVVRGIDQKQVKNAQIIDRVNGEPEITSLRAIIEKQLEAYQAARQPTQDKELS